MDTVMMYHSVLQNIAESDSVPLVTVALPVYNGSATLALAIRSILLQTLQNWELILVDDGSTDSSLEVVREFNDPRIRIVAYEINRNLPTSLNEAVRLARGKYLARMDQDDISFPDRLKIQVDYLERHPDVDLVGAGILVFNNSGVCLGKLPVPENHEGICRRPWSGFYLPHPTWMGRIEWFRTNPYNPEAVNTEDQDLLFRAHQTSKFACLTQILLAYREDIRRFGKMFRARSSFLRSTTEYALLQNNWLLAAKVASCQVLKICGDLLFFYFNAKKIRSPLPRVSEEELAEWKSVWNMLEKAEELSQSADSGLAKDLAK